MSRASLSAIAVALLAAPFAAASFAALYKWTDAQGHVVYSDQPPPTSIKSEQLRAPPPPANPNAAKELAQEEAAYRKHVTDEATARATAARARAAEADRAHGCELAKANLLQLADQSTPIARYGADGQRSTMSDAARAQERERLTAWMRDNKCPG